MPQRKLLLDSNAYFRLAQSVRPLLGVEFGADCICLYVITDLQREFDRSSRLQNRFPWVDTPEYVENRRRAISVSRKQGKQIDLAISVIDGHARVSGLGTSPVDVRALATASVLGVTLVSDDIDLLELARAFGVVHLRTLELLHLMTEVGHRSHEQVRAIAAYWRASSDIPADYKADWRRLFDTDPP